MLQCYLLKQKMLSGEYVPQEGTEFPLNERGRQRLIKAPSIFDRVVQKALCQAAILPAITPRIIHDNGASIKGKGLAFARRRFEQHLREFYREHGRDGYLGMMDFSKYFDNLRHEIIKRQYKHFLTPSEYATLCAIVDSFAPDVSYMTDEEYDIAMDTLYNALEHRGYHGNGSKHLHKGANIGAELSQPIGVYYPHSIDDYIKTVCGERWYGRYMDDSYLMGVSKEHIRERFAEIEDCAHKLGITVNHKKTHIVPLNRPFVFLKMKYLLTATGHVHRRPVKDTFARERTRIAYLAGKIEEGAVTEEYARNCYKSWRKSLTRYDCRRTINEMDKLFARTIGHF